MDSLFLAKRLRALAATLRAARSEVTAYDGDYEYTEFLYDDAAIDSVIASLQNIAKFIESVDEIDHDKIPGIGSEEELRREMAEYDVLAHEFSAEQQKALRGGTDIS